MKVVVWSVISNQTKGIVQSGDRRGAVLAGKPSVLEALFKLFIISFSYLHCSYDDKTIDFFFFSHGGVVQRRKGGDLSS